MYTKALVITKPDTYVHVRTTKVNIKITEETYVHMFVLIHIIHVYYTNTGLIMNENTLRLTHKTDLVE